jgi:hypothetical protein
VPANNKSRKTASTVCMAYIKKMLKMNQVHRANKMTYTKDMIQANLNDRITHFKELQLINSSIIRTCCMQRAQHAGWTGVL